MADLPIKPPPLPVEDIDIEPDPPSLRVRASRLGGKAVKLLGAATLLVGAAIQVTALFRPDLVGPLEYLLKILQALG